MENSAEQMVMRQLHLELVKPPDVHQIVLRLVQHRGGSKLWMICHNAQKGSLPLCQCHKAACVANLLAEGILSTTRHVEGGAD